MSNPEVRFKRIVNVIEMIRRRPKKNVKYFTFDTSAEDGVLKFIIEGKKIRLLPMSYSHLYDKDEFYIHFNLSEKKVMYYSFCIPDLFSGEPTDEEQGFMEWKDIEECLHAFLTLNIRELTDVIAPHSHSSIDKEEANFKPPVPTYRPPYTPPVPSKDEHKTTSYGYPYYDSLSNNTNHIGYGSSAYKEREAFYDKLHDLLKYNKTTKAIDHTVSFFTAKHKDNKIDEIDAVVKGLTFDKLNIPTMLEILRMTQKISLKERAEFVVKVKAYITKVKPARYNMVMNNLDKSLVSSLSVN